MKVIKYFCSLLIVLFGALAAFASNDGEPTARVAGLETDTVYMSLLKQEQQLKIEEDSIEQKIATIRGNFASVAQEDRASVGRLILDSENTLFEVRNQIGIITSKINIIEQEYIINNLNKATAAGPATIAPATTSFESYAQAGPELYANQFFDDNLSDYDLKNIRETIKYEDNIAQLEKKYFANYAKLSELLEQYNACDNQYTADTIKNMFGTIEGLNNAIEDSVARTMETIFDNKLYTFNYLYDKLSKGDMLKELEENLLAMNAKIDERPENALPAPIYNLPYQRRFLCDQEIAIATYLKATQASDSLKLLRAKLLSKNSNIPRLEIKDRIFIEYDSIVIVKTAIYNSKNPIPKLEHYKHGTVYRLLLGSYIRPQPAYIFRNATPLYHDVADKRNNYYTGGFETLEQAQQAQKAMKKVGFANPRIVVWIDDVFENITEAMAAGNKPSAASSKTSAATLYRVEVMMNNSKESIGPAHQNAISSVAANKELSKLFTPDGQPIFVIGTFKTMDEAEKLVNALNSIGDCRATVKQL